MSELEKTIVENVEDMFISAFRSNTSNLNKRVTRFSYAVSILTDDLTIHNRFLDEGIAFCPKGMLDTDLPLNIDKSNRVLREAIEFLFSVNIQEEKNYLDGDYHGIIFVANNKLGVNAIRIKFSLSERIKYSDIQNYVIELPKTEFNFDSVDSPKDYYFERKSKIGHFVGSEKVS
jgi:hypothetical protein